MKRLLSASFLLLILALAWGGAFVVASSLALERGFPKQTALIIGLGAFPAGPLLANIVAELVRWRRRARTSEPARPGLTALDRWLLRALVIDLLVIAAVLAAAWTDTTRALREHATWWLDPWPARPRSLGDRRATQPAPSASTTPRGTTESPSASSSATTPPLEARAPLAAGCIDGQYRETLAPHADISDLVAGYSPPRWREFALAALARRYPFGKQLVEEGARRTDCASAFMPDSQRASADAVLAGLSTVTHECGHFYDLGIGGAVGKLTYHVAPNVSFHCSGGAVQGAPPRTLPRSLLMRDAFASQRASCGASNPAGECDSYAAIYLNGDPNDKKHDSGDQGLDLLVEELVQYIHSLATARALRDKPLEGRRTSERDGVLTMLWYLERYLLLLRSQAPKAHADLLASDCWPKTLLTLWGRAWLFLEATREDPSLGIDDEAIEALVRRPELLAEIDRLRRAARCP
jgi:hypothetical protein